MVAPGSEELERVVGAMLGTARQDWEQGLAGQALLALGRLPLVRVLARDAVTRQRADGRLADIDGGGLVNGAANLDAVDVVAAGTDGPAGAAARAADLQRRWLVTGCPRADDGTLFHLAGSRQVWADTVHMVAPGWPTPAERGGADLPVAVADQLDGHHRRLWDPVSGLYASRWDEDEARLVDPRHWGTGNGWVLTGTALALHRCWREGPRATAAIARSRALLDAILAHRRADGSFGDVLDDPGSFSDATAGLMVAWAVATGVADGWLPVSRLEVSRALLSLAAKRVDDDGFVTGVCGSPRFDRPGTSAEAQAVFVLAHVAIASAQISLVQAP